MVKYKCKSVWKKFPCGDMKKEKVVFEYVPESIVRHSSRKQVLKEPLDKLEEYSHR